MAAFSTLESGHPAFAFPASFSNVACPPRELETTSFLQLNDPSSHRSRHCLRAAQHVELCEDALEVGFDGDFAYEQLSSDLFVAPPRRQRAQHDRFAF